MIKFLYGHIPERVVLFLTELAGHKVTDEQKEVKVGGILGHMDCKIDGEVIDIKSASGYVFQSLRTALLQKMMCSDTWHNLLDTNKQRSQQAVDS